MNSRDQVESSTLKRGKEKTRIGLRFWLWRDVAKLTFEKSFKKNVFKKKKKKKQLVKKRFDVKKKFRQINFCFRKKFG